MHDDLDVFARSFTCLFFFQTSPIHQRRIKRVCSNSHSVSIKRRFSNRFVSFLSLYFGEGTSNKVLHPIAEHFGVLDSALIGMTSYWLTPASAVLFVLSSIWLDHEFSQPLDALDSIQVHFIFNHNVALLFPLSWC